MADDEKLSKKLMALSGGQQFLSRLFLGTAVDALIQRSDVDEDAFVADVAKVIEKRLGEPLPQPVPDGFWNNLRVSKFVNNSGTNKSVK